MNIKDIKTDYRHFKGGISCKLHKKYGVHCLNENESDYKCIKHLHPKKGYTTNEEPFSR